MNPYVQYMYSYPHKTAYGPLESVSLKDHVSCLKGSGNGLYLHLPFCRTRCGYCNLFTVTGQEEALADCYLEAVERQSRQYQELLFPQGTVFSEMVIGGGTPLLLTEGQLVRMFRMLEKGFLFSGNRELVIETSPNETSRGKLEILKQAGVTRVSMGIQSFSEKELGTLRRRHGAARAEEALALIKEYDFSSVNVDFIYGIPGQTVGSLLGSLKRALAYAPDEIFLYPLYVKHGAFLQREWKDGQVLKPEDALTQYRESAAYLQAEGYRQDSMRRFVRKEGTREYSECGMGRSLALGCGGRSYLGALHFCSPYTVTRQGCLEQLAHFVHTGDYTKITHGILLTEDEQKRRHVIRHLLIRPGLLLREYEEQFGNSALYDFSILEKWEECGYVQREGEYLALTETGMELSDWLGPQLISEEIRRRMEEWEYIHGRNGASVQGESEEL